MCHNISWWRYGRQPIQYHHRLQCFLLSQYGVDMIHNPYTTTIGYNVSMYTQLIVSHCQHVTFYHIINVSFYHNTLHVTMFVCYATSSTTICHNLNIYRQRHLPQYVTMYIIYHHMLNATLSVLLHGPFKTNDINNNAL